MFKPLPESAVPFMTIAWEDMSVYYQELLAAPLSEETKLDWLAYWSALSERFSEAYKRLYIATTVDTTDTVAEEKLFTFLDNVLPYALSADNELQKKFVESGVHIENFEVPLKHIKAELELFTSENLPLLTQQDKLGTEYDKIIGAQTIEWDGEERTLSQMQPVLQDTDRAVREKAWRAMMDRRMQDRDALNALWQRLLKLRLQIAENAGFESFRDYRWKQLGRFDYTPEDCITFQNAIEQVVVPAAIKLAERRKQELGVSQLREWDLAVDPTGKPPLRPFSDASHLINKTSVIFHQIDPHLGQYFDDMHTSDLLDLENRKGKAPGGYCESFDVLRKPFIFMNAVGIHDDVQTMLHESGHAFHVFESADLPYYQQLDPPMEFAEVASMSMEFLGAPYLTEFYNEADAARARTEFLEDSILFWCYMAVVDAFQHWVYENSSDALDPDKCDEKWQSLERRFRPYLDWTGLEEVEKTGWHRKLHIFQVPFYYVEYGLAQLGAVQVWHNALQDQNAAVARYREALSLGGTQSLPELFAAAGAQFAFDPGTLQQAVSLITDTLDSLAADQPIV